MRRKRGRLRRFVGGLVRATAWGIVAVAAVAVLVAVAVWREVTQDLPPVGELHDYRPPTATLVFAADGTLLGEFFVERRYIVSIDAVPQHVKDAFLATEDVDFYEHRGVDPSGMVRAIKANFEHGQIVQGASTITQQVVKQLLLSPERSIERKLKEVILALELESRLAKDDILSLYLNQIYFGAGTYGIAAAAQELFGKTVGELTLAEGALLAGLPKAPSRYDPLRRPEAALERQRSVLDRMLRAGFIDADEHRAALAEEIRFTPPKSPTYATAPWYLAHVRQLLEEQYGPDFGALGLRVHTALDLRLQAMAEEAVEEGVERLARRFGRRSRGKDAALEGALVAIDPTNGQVKALVGGVDYARSQFNRAVHARRQPGSAFKPFIYAAAIDAGYTPATIVQDAPISLPAGRGKTWSPKNYGDRYMGPVPLRTALAQSLNSVSVRVALDIGIDRLREYLRIFPFPIAFPRHLSLALGTSEVTPLELTAAYGVFATLGRRFTPVFITAVTDADGNPVDFPGSRPRFEAVMNPATAYVMTRMMGAAVESGTGREARKVGRPAAGKTGTTNDSRDAWFVGFTPELLAGAWVGFDSHRSLGSYTGGRAAAPIWTDFMKRALAGREESTFPVPENVSLVQVDTATGLRAVPGRKARTEAFVAGTEPERFAPRPAAAAPEETDQNETR